MVEEGAEVAMEDDDEEGVLREIVVLIEEKEKMDLLEDELVEDAVEVLEDVKLVVKEEEEEEIVGVDDNEKELLEDVMKRSLGRRETRRRGCRGRCRLKMRWRC